MYLINKSCVCSECIILSGSVGRIEPQTCSVTWLHTNKSICARSEGSYVEGVGFIASTAIPL